MSAGTPVGAGEPVTPVGAGEPVTPVGAGAEAGVGRGLGKLLLCGEHAVVYGHPAIAFAVDRATQVTLEPRPGPTTIESSVADERLRTALGAAVEREGFAVRIDSDVPIGRGMGSSAALAVALVRARAALSAEALDADEVFARALPIERVFHGNPSGVDVAVSSRGGFLRYQRVDGVPRVEAIAQRPRWGVVVLDSGEAGDTAALVAGVAARRPGIDDVLDRIGALVGQAFDHLDDIDALGPMLTENHALLGRIGVSNPTLDALVRLAIDAGARGAKLAGAGGGGVVLALVDDPEPVLRAAARQRVTAFACAPAPLATEAR